MKCKVIRWLLAIGCVMMGIGNAAFGEQATRAGALAEWIKDPVALLTHLKQRDAAFDSRTLRVDQIWTEKVYPKSQLAAARRAALRFGQQAPKQTPTDSVPGDFEQPHRLRHLLTARESEVTIEQEGELEKMKHPRYVAISNKGHRWSNVGGRERSYSPATNTVHLMGKTTGGTLLSHQWMFEWCCGYGFAKRIESIESVSVEGDRLFVKGKAKLMGYDDSRIEMELDRDYIVRRATLAVPVQIGTGNNKYVVETQGTAAQDDCPPLAKTGRRQRYLRPGGKPERLHKSFEIALVDLSPPLTDEQYKERTTINPPDDARISDFRPLDQR